MKSFVILIGMLMPLWILSQNITLTKEQESRVKEIFTPEKIIEVSKGLDNEKRQSIVIEELQSKIDSLKVISVKKDKLIDGYIKSINNLSIKILALNEEEEDVSDDILKNAKKPFLGLHFKLGVIAQEFKLERFNAFADLSYDLSKFSVGVKGWSQSLLIEDKITNQLFYGPFLVYKIF